MNEQQLKDAKIAELKAAVDQLGVAVIALREAEQEEANWKFSDLHRQDGSRAQDERHERMGQKASERVGQARLNFNLQKDLVEKLTRAI